MSIFDEIRCVDCDHYTLVRPKEREKELKAMGWVKKGEGWQCPHCSYASHK